MVLLPLAFIGILSNEQHNLRYSSSFSWSRGLFLASFIAQKINDYIVYSHVGLNRLANWRSMEVWCAPCKSTYIALCVGPPLIFYGRKRRCQSIYPVFTSIHDKHSHIRALRLYHFPRRRAIATIPQTADQTPSHLRDAHVLSIPNLRSRSITAMLAHRTNGGNNRPGITGTDHTISARGTRG